MQVWWWWMRWTSVARRENKHMNRIVAVDIFLYNYKFLLTTLLNVARGGAVGGISSLQAINWRYRFPMLPRCIVGLLSTQFLKFSVGWGGELQSSGSLDDNLIAFMRRLSWTLEVSTSWFLRASPDLYRDCFSFLPFLIPIKLCVQFRGFLALLTKNNLFYPNYCHF